MTTLIKHVEGGTNTRLSSPRRYGKTSLLMATLAEADRLGLGSVYVDLYGARTVAQVHARIERAYERQLKGTLARSFAAVKRALGGTGVNTPVGGLNAPSQATATERALLDLLDVPRRLHDKTGIRIALAFDEFQELLSAGEDVDALLRSVIQHHGGAATYVFAGSHPGLMAGLFGDRSRPFYGQAAPLLLDRLDDEDLAGYVGARFDETGRDSGAALSWLLAVADGHPQRAMLLAHLLWDATKPGEVADEEHWSRALDAVEAFVRDEFEATWGSLSDVERGVLEAVASGGARLTAASTLASFNLTKGGAPPAAARLEADGLLVRDAGRPSGYRIVDPLLARWVANDRSWR